MALKTLTPALLAEKNRLNSTHPFAWLLQIEPNGVPPFLRYLYNTRGGSVTFHGNAFTPRELFVGDIEDGDAGDIAEAELIISVADKADLGVFDTQWVPITPPNWTLRAWYVDITQPDETPLASAGVYRITKMRADQINMHLTLKASGVSSVRMAHNRHYTRAQGFPI